MAFEVEGMAEARAQRQEQPMEMCIGGRGRTIVGRGRASEYRPFSLGSGAPLKVLTGPGQMYL